MSIETDLATLPTEEGLVFREEDVCLSFGLGVLMQEAKDINSSGVSIHSFPDLLKLIEWKQLVDEPFFTIVRVTKKTSAPAHALFHCFVKFDGSALMYYGVPDRDEDLAFIQAFLAQHIGMLFSRFVGTSLHEGSEGEKGQAWTAANRLFRFIGRRIFFTKESILASQDGREPRKCDCYEIFPPPAPTGETEEEWLESWACVLSKPGLGDEAYNNIYYSIGWVCYDVKRGLEDEKYPFYLEGGFRKPFSEISDNLSSIIGDAEKDVKKALKDCQLRYRFSAPHAEALQKSGPWVAMLMRLIPIHCHALRTTLPNYKYLAYSLHRFQPPVPNWTVIHK